MFFFGFLIWQGRKAWVENVQFPHKVHYGQLEHFQIFYRHRWFKFINSLWIIAALSTVDPKQLPKRHQLKLPEWHARPRPDCCWLLVDIWNPLLAKIPWRRRTVLCIFLYVEQVHFLPARTSLKLHKFPVPYFPALNGTIAELASFLGQLKKMSLTSSHVPQGNSIHRNPDL